MPTSGELQLIKIAVLENAIEAQLIGSILEQRDIPHRLRSYYDTAYDGLFQFQEGWGNLYAPQSHQQEISEIIENVRSNHFFYNNNKLDKLLDKKGGTVMAEINTGTAADFEKALQQL